MRVGLKPDRWHACLVVALVLIAPPDSGHTQVAGTLGTTIIVNSAADAFVIVPPGSPPVCTLRDAIQAANTNLQVAGCPAGQEPKLISAQPLRVDFVDRIEFDIGPDTPIIQLRRALPFVLEAVTIDGATHGARRVEIAGARIVSLGGLPPPHGFVVLDSYSTLKSLVINGFRGVGILLTHVDEDEKPLLAPPIPEKLDEEWSDPCASELSQLDPQGCRPDPPTDPDLPSFRAGGGSHIIIDCLIGTDATGKVAVPNGDGIVVLTAGNTIGGMRRGMRNVISGNGGNGILLDSVNNRVFGNSIGVGAGNRLNGVVVDGGPNQQATCDIRGNAIVSNGASGVDAGFNFCWILSNSIANNGALGIERAAAGPTANNPTRTRPPNHPILETFGPDPSGRDAIIVTGTIVQLSTQPIALQLYDSPTCDPSGFGEGANLIASAVPQGTSIRFVAPALQRVGNHFYTATASTTAGGTSEFSPCLPH
jgi:CSLREA domain-containing protein